MNPNDDTNWMLEQDEYGQWWCATSAQWVNHRGVKVVDVPERRKCTVDVGKIAVMRLAGYDVVIPGIGSWYIRGPPEGLIVYDCDPGSKVVLTIEE